MPLIEEFFTCITTSKQAVDFERNTLRSNTGKQASKQASKQ